MRQLTRFAIDPREDDFVIRLQDETGAQMEFSATPDQLDAVVVALDDVLAENEEEFFGVQDRGQPLHRPLA